MGALLGRSNYLQQGLQLSTTATQSSFE